ncbi:chromatin assembly factor 1 subunit A-domain-containing protein [Phascolomyces articulosus]|uniref:Chromatin assembly factor 1 subunit A-domain-containing protein n=1 Tax=Phascolomyces articulosus TaxID=60185 RepID=A0AAD5K0R2_9FUNG|nr:chromatin assembly factor 1 subunit A-domain-containing protein [Phascolomyces articulosus]
MSVTDSPEQQRLYMTAQQLQALRVDDPPVHTMPEFLKDGKLVFNEPKLRAENQNDMAERIKQFREHRAWMEQNMELQTISEFPKEFLDVLSALCQDSDESSGQLSHRINEILSPFLRNEQFSDKFNEVIESAVKSIATRTKYGVSPSVLKGLECGITHIPQNLSFSRWEVKNIDPLPHQVRAVIEQRRVVRMQMSSIVSASFERLPLDQQILLLQNKHNRKTHDETKTAVEIEEKRKKKEEEKRIREEEKRKREEEKKIRDEERKKREEEKRKKEQSQLRLTSLFTKAPEEKLTCSGQNGSNKSKGTKSMFPSFYIKEHVTMHSWTIATSKSNDELDHYLKNLTTDKYRACEVSNDLRSHYLKTLKQSKPELTAKRGCCQNMNLRTILLGPDMENFNQLQISMKLLQFTEDVRPAYYGTWTKSSKKINGQKPLAKDEDLVDYEHDSEGEWEPEGEGEEIQSGDEDDDDPASDIADPEDAGWLVPEGYLSEDEGVESDDERTNQVRPAMRPTRKHTAIRPVIVGPIFEDGDLAEDEPLKRYATRMLFNYPSNKPYNPFHMETDDSTTNTKQVSSATEDPNKKSVFTPQHENELINIIEGKKAEAMPKLVSEAKANWLLRDVSKRQLEMKIKDLAVKEKRGSDTKAAWHIKETSNNK